MKPAKQSAGRGLQERPRQSKRVQKRRGRLRRSRGPGGVARLAGRQVPSKVKKVKRVRMLKRYNVYRRGIHDGFHFPESVAAFGQESSVGWFEPLLTF